MKKTRKALLAVLACSAALAGAVGLAACGGGDDGDNGNSHDHTWGNWTVATQPTNEATGKATRTCSGEGTCDAAATDKEYTLPVLSSTDYTKGNDTATCSAGGSVEYTFDKDGVSVSFTVTTAVNATEHNYGEYVNDDPEGHYKVCSGNSAHTTDKEAHDTAGTDGACSVCEYKHVHKWSSWTVAEEDEPTAESTGKATRTCSGAGDCDATAADKEYELPMLNETDYTVIQTGRASCVENGRFSYVFEKDGVSAIFLVTTDVDSHAHSLEFHEGEESTCEKPGREDYYACGKCGKLFSDEEGQEEIEEEDVLIPANGHDIDEVPAHNASTSPNTKALKYPNNSAASATGMAHYKCNVCEKTFKDAEGENEITSTYALARAGMLLDFGANSVDATGVAYAKSGTNYCAFYIAESDGVFTFDFDEEVNIAQLIYMLTGTKANDFAYSNVTSSTITTAGWQTGGGSFNKFVVPDATQAPGNSVTVSMVKGEWLIIVVDQVAFNVEVGKAPILLVGENTVEITEAYAQFIDEYQFVPTATKKYSMTVPAGVEVLMNDEDFIVGEDRTVNFEATAGEEIVFAFKYIKVGTVTVTIGDKFELPKLTTDASLANFAINARGASVLEIGDIEEGQYTVTIVLSNGVMRSQIFFGKNISENFDDYYLTNGSWADSNPAWVNFQFPQAQVINGADCTTTRNMATCTVTLNLKVGDKLVFMTSAGTSGSANISMAKAA